eukprot:3582007-Pleurochrysis_carterae.AAC.1
MLSKVWPTLRPLIYTGSLPQAPQKGKGSACTSLVADVDSNIPPSAPSSPRTFSFNPALLTMCVKLRMWLLASLPAVRQTNHCFMTVMAAHWTF